MRVLLTQSAVSLIGGIALLVIAYVSMTFLSLYPVDNKVYFYLASVLLASAGLGIAFYHRKKIDARTVLAMAVFFHVVGLLGQPLLEDDHYRYLWDGYRFVEAGTPYGVAPETFFNRSDVPESMHAVLNGINYPEVPTIYAPVLQFVFAAGYWIAPAEFWPIKLILSLANLSLIALLLRIVSPRQVLLYAWNPLVFKEVALTGHPDALIALPLLLAWQWRGIGGPWLKGALYGIALAIKISILPTMAWLLWRGRYWAIVVAAFTIFVSYLPFAGNASDLAGFAVFARDWQFNAAVYQWLSAIVHPQSAKWICMLLAAVLMFWIQWRERDSDLFPPWHRVFGVLLLFSPVINPWYLLWLLPFAVFSRDVWPWVASFSISLSYLTGLNTGREDVQAFEVLPVAQCLQWGLIVLAVLFDFYKRKFSAQQESFSEGADNAVLLFKKTTD
jgi:alpha-1,6-mannosyltransferase